MILLLGRNKRGLMYFVGATLVVQILIILVGLYLRAGMSAPEVVMPDFSEQELSRSLAESELDQQGFEQYGAAASAGIEQLEEPQEPLLRETVKVVKHLVARGDTLTRIWAKYGAPYQGSIHAAAAFKAAGVPLKAIAIGETLELQISPDGDITGLRKELKDGRVLLLDGNSEDGYENSIIEPEIIEQERTVSGMIDHSFSVAAQRVDLPYHVIDALVDLFGNEVEFRRDVQPGDTFVVRYVERRLSDGRRLDGGFIKAASLVNSGRMLAAVRYVDANGKEHFYNQNGEPIGNFFLRYPVRFSRISSVFSHSRLHPILNIRRPHHGVDFAAPIGTPVRSVADGTVIASGYSGGAGNMIKIRHCSRYTSVYMHLKNFASGIKKGARIERGQVIGYVGSSGLSTGPHLDYRFMDNGTYVDPLQKQLPRMPSDYEVIPATYLKENIEQMQQSLSELHLASVQPEWPVG